MHADYPNNGVNLACLSTPGFPKTNEEMAAIDDFPNRLDEFRVSHAAVSIFAVDVVEDRPRKAPFCQATEVMEVVAVFKAHGSDPPIFQKATAGREAGSLHGVPRLCGDSRVRGVVRQAVVGGANGRRTPE